MRRLVVLIVMLGLVAGLVGAIPASAAPPQCQVVAVDRAKTCSFIAKSSSINILIAGSGTVAIYDGFGLYSQIWCPAAGAQCLGVQPYKDYVAPGDRVVLTVNVGFGRVQTGLP